MILTYSQTNAFIRPTKRPNNGLTVRDLAMETTEKLRVVIIKEGDVWNAQCLEYDIGAQAKDLSELQSRFAAVFEAERDASAKEGGEEFAGIDPAPDYYHDLWAKTYATVARKVRSDAAETRYEMAMVA